VQGAGLGTGLNQPRQHSGNRFALGGNVLQVINYDIVNFMCNNGLSEKFGRRTFGDVQKIDRLLV